MLVALIMQVQMKNDYLSSTDIIDYHHPDVAREAARLAAGTFDAVEIVRACFLFVRDEVLHSSDHRRNPVTLRASDVLRHRTGYCFAKSILLAALLRANGIPAGLCYQRLWKEDLGCFILHGLVAAHLPGIGWYRMDPRGNNERLSADFTPPVEALPYRPSLPGEADLPEIWPDPLSVVVDKLTANRTWQEVLADLPDVEVVNSK